MREHASLTINIYILKVHRWLQADFKVLCLFSEYVNLEVIPISIAIPLTRLTTKLKVDKIVQPLETDENLQTIYTLLQPINSHDIV